MKEKEKGFIVVVVVVCRSDVAGEGGRVAKRIERARSRWHCRDSSGRNCLALKSSRSRRALQPSGQELRVRFPPAGRPLRGAAQIESGAHQGAPGERSLSPRAVR